MRGAIVGAVVLGAAAVVGGAFALARRLEHCSERAWPAYGLTLHTRQFCRDHDRISHRPSLIIECGLRTYRMPLR